MSCSIASTYSISSFVGFVSSKRRLHWPPYSPATPKLRQIDLACPMCRCPFGSGGKRVITRAVLPAARSSSTISRSEEHTSELQSPDHLVCRLLLEKKKTKRLKHAGNTV